MNYLLPVRLDRLAREYALGTLAGPARRRFERVVRSSAAASMAVDVWRRRLSVLDLAAAPVQPPESTWQGIERRLFSGPNQSASTATPIGGALQALRVGMEPRFDALPASYVGVLLDPVGKAALVASSRRQGRQLTVKLLQPLNVPAGHVAQL